MQSTTITFPQGLAPFSMTIIEAAAWNAAHNMSVPQVPIQDDCKGCLPISDRMSSYPGENDQIHSTISDKLEMRCGAFTKLQIQIIWASTIAHGFGCYSDILKHRQQFKGVSEMDLHAYLHSATGLFVTTHLIGLHVDLNALKEYSMIQMMKAKKADLVSQRAYSEILHGLYMSHQWYWYGDLVPKAEIRAEIRSQFQKMFGLSAPEIALACAFFGEPYICQGPPRKPTPQSSLVEIDDFLEYEYENGHAGVFPLDLDNRGCVKKKAGKYGTTDYQEDVSSQSDEMDDFDVKRQKKVIQEHKDFWVASQEPIMQQLQTANLVVDDDNVLSEQANDHNPSNSPAGETASHPVAHVGAPQNFVAELRSHTFVDRIHDLEPIEIDGQAIQIQLRLRSCKKACQYLRPGQTNVTRVVRRL